MSSLKYSPTHWSFVASPQRDEEFLSWLTRQSSGLGTSEVDLMRVVRRNLGIKLGGFCLSRDERQFLAFSTGIDIDEQWPETLYWQSSNYYKQLRYRDETGLCPQCLNTEIQFIRRSWSYDVICRDHNVIMIYRCPQCEGRPILDTSRGVRRLPYCFYCEYDFRTYKADQAEAGLLVLQSILNASFTNIKKPTSKHERFIAMLWDYIRFYTPPYTGTGFLDWIHYEIDLSHKSAYDDLKLLQILTTDWPWNMLNLCIAYNYYSGSNRNATYKFPCYPNIDKIGIWLHFIFTLLHKQIDPIWLMNVDTALEITDRWFDYSDFHNDDRTYLYRMVRDRRYIENLSQLSVLNDNAVEHQSPTLIFPSIPTTNWMDIYARKDERYKEYYYIHSPSSDFDLFCFR